MLRKIPIKAGVLILGFAIGILVNSVFSTRVERDSAPIPAVAARIDQWHRLYEAAGMTGDGEIIKQVSDRMACASDAGESKGVLVTIDQGVFCRTSDGDSELTDYPGSLWQQIKESHLSWSLKNSEFVASVANPEAAREYLRQHQWP